MRFIVEFRVQWVGQVEWNTLLLAILKYCHYLYGLIELLLILSPNKYTFYGRI